MSEVKNCYLVIVNNVPVGVAARFFGITTSSSDFTAEVLFLADKATGRIQSGSVYCSQFNLGGSPDYSRYADKIINIDGSGIWREDEQENERFNSLFYIGRWGGTSSMPVMRRRINQGEVPSNNTRIRRGQVDVPSGVVSESRYTWSDYQTFFNGTTGIRIEDSPPPTQSENRRERTREPRISLPPRTWTLEAVEQARIRIEENQRQFREHTRNRMENTRQD